MTSVWLSETTDIFLLDVSDARLQLCNRASVSWNFTYELTLIWGSRWAASYLDLKWPKALKQLILEGVQSSRTEQNKIPLYKNDFVQKKWNWCVSIQKRILKCSRKYNSSSLKNNLYGYSPHATLASGSCLRWASNTASLIWSQILSVEEQRNRKSVRTFAGNGKSQLNVFCNNALGCWGERPCVLTFIRLLMNQTILMWQIYLITYI